MFSNGCWISRRWNFGDISRPLSYRFINVLISPDLESPGRTSDIFTFTVTFEFVDYIVQICDRSNVLGDTSQPSSGFKHDPQANRVECVFHRTSCLVLGTSWHVSYVCTMGGVAEEEDNWDSFQLLLRASTKLIGSRISQSATTLGQYRSAPISPPPLLAVV